MRPSAAGRGYISISRVGPAPNSLEWPVYDGQHETRPGSTRPDLDVGLIGPKQQFKCRLSMTSERKTGTVHMLSELLPMVVRMYSHVRKCFFIPLHRILTFKEIDTMKHTLTILILAGLSQACIAGSGYELTDTRARAIVVADVLTAKCPKLYQSDAYYRYRMAASRLLSVATVDSERYQERYQKLNEITDSLTPEKMKADCQDFVPRIADMIPEMEKDYAAYLDIIDADRRKEANSWSMALEMISAFASGMGQAAMSHNYSFIPIPSGKVNFGLPQRGGRSHYLVNTPGGMQQCYVASSGNVFCN